VVFLPLFSLNSSLFSHNTLSLSLLISSVIFLCYIWFLLFFFFGFRQASLNFIFHTGVRWVSMVLFAPAVRSCNCTIWKQKHSLLTACQFKIRNLGLLLWESSAKLAFCQLCYCLFKRERELNSDRFCVIELKWFKSIYINKNVII